VSGLRHSRATASCGIAFVALDLAALSLPGSPPKATDSARHTAQALASHRTALLAATYLAGLALVALLFFLRGLRSWILRVGGDDGWTLAAAGGAMLAIAAQLMGMVLFYGAAFKVAAQHQDPLVRALTDGGNAGVELSKFGFASFIACVCLGARQALPAPLSLTGVAAAALLVASAIPLLGGGAWSQFGSVLDLLGGSPALLWLVALSAALFSGRTLRREVAAAGASAPA
jgi:hypothetical protein